MKALSSILAGRSWDFRAFLKWWASELTFLVPEPLSQWWRRRSNRVLVRASGTATDMHLSSVAGVRLLGQWPYGEEQDANLGPLIASDPETDGAETVLLLSAGEVLLRSIVLPAAAAENLLQVVGFEMDHYTPFKSSQLYFDARLVDALPDGARIRVEFAALPKEPLDSLVTRLAAAGLRFDRVDVEPAGRPLEQAGFNLLPEQFRSQQSRLPLRLAQGLAVLLCVLLTTLVWLPVSMDDAFLDRLQDEVRSASKAAKAVEAMREETEQLAKAAAFVLDQKLSQPPLLMVLEELTERLPDDVWLNAVQVRDKHIELQGQAKTASALIALLENSPYLNNTTFLAPVTPDPTSKTERFRIGADIVLPAPEALVKQDAAPAAAKPSGPPALPAEFGSSPPSADAPPAPDALPPPPGMGAPPLPPEFNGVDPATPPEDL